MNRFETLTVVIVLAVALGVPATLAAGPGGDDGPTAIDGTLRFINPQLGLIQLSDGTELRVPDPRQLETLKVGDQVHIWFEQRNNRNYVLSIARTTN